MFIGSCFAENIGEKFSDAKFSSIINPHGILYDPLSLSRSLKSYLNNTQVQENDLFFSNETWHSWDHHSKFSDPDRSRCLGNINASISSAHAHIKDAKWVFITFGSAFFYALKDRNIPVGNCHKVPQKEFDKSLIKTETIIKEYNKLISEIRSLSASLNIVFTVSPVRYIRDGVVENNLSKSILLQSVHELVKANENVFYFPAYELVIDDLRDYRFFKEDLVHPNELAIQYVFEKLKIASFSEATEQLFLRISEIRNALAHRPFNENSEAHKKFRTSYALRCKQLVKEFPFLDLNEELLYFS
jgi:hypothetical protein